MIKGAIKIALVSVVLYVIIKFVINQGFHLHYKKHYPGNCKAVKGLDYGSEDFEVTKDGLVFVTSGVSLSIFSSKFIEFIKTKNIQGNIFVFDFKNPDLGARKLQVKASKDFQLNKFRPHGISLLEDEAKGEHLLYVINHPEDADDAVEKFRYLPKTNELVHLKSFTSDKFHINNDVTVLEEDKFFVSDCLYFKTRFLSILEQLFQLNLGSLLFFDGKDIKVVQSGLNGPNGISLSKDKRFLYVSHPGGQLINVYTVNADSSLKLIQTADVHTAPDNLHFSQTGDALYTGAHPIMHKIFEHITDPETTAPSSVLKIPLKNGKIVTEDITELFFDHGDLISGSSIAAVYNKKLLIGSVISKLVVCDVNV